MSEEEGQQLEQLPVERFAEELERMMIAGHSQLSLKRWALSTYGADENILYRFQEIIRRSWQTESGCLAQVKQRKDFLRLKYLEIYEQAMRCENYLPAVKALDSIAKMDGLMDGDVNLTQVNINGEQITNGVRDRIQQLAETMRLRAEKRASDNLRIIDAKVLPKKIG